jgi:hypothetical protein
MNIVHRRLFGGGLPGCFLFAAAVGCAPEGHPPIESLPWNNASIPASASDVESPSGSDKGSLAQANSGELQFRDRIVQKYLKGLRRIAAEPLVVKAVKAANDSGWQSQQQIDQIDLRWRQTMGTDDPLVQKYLKNRCADWLRQNQQQNASYVELFVMDGKGCIVAESDKTSDYWQGDEPKWIECFNGGKGRIHVGEVEYDQSTQLYVVQISLPVRDEHQTTIGAVTVSVSSGSHD